jgi:hypothetical protein
MKIPILPLNRPDLGIEFEQLLIELAPRGADLD